MYNTLSDCTVYVLYSTVHTVLHVLYSTVHNTVHVQFRAVRPLFIYVMNRQCTDGLLSQKRKNTRDLSIIA